MFYILATPYDHLQHSELEFLELATRPIRFLFFFYSRDPQPCFLSVNNLKFYSWLKLQFSPEWSLTSFALNFKCTIQQGLRKRPNTHQSNPHNNIDFSTLKQQTARIPSKGLFCSILILNPFHIQAYSVYSFTSFAFPGKLREIPRIWQQQHNKGRKPTKTLEKSATNLLQVSDKSQAHFEDISKMFCLQNQMIIVYRLHWTLLSYVNRFIYYGRLGQNVTIWTHHNLNIPQSKHILIIPLDSWLWAVWTWGLLCELVYWLC